MNTLKKHLPKFILTALYWIIASILWSRYGLKVVNDSARYLEYAQNLSSHGFYFDPHNFWYFGYVLFIFLVSLINESLYFLIFCQYILSFIAILALYEAALLFFNHKLAGLLSCLLMLLFIEAIMWNSYILPESFYLSILCIFFYSVIRLYKGKRGLKSIIGMLVLLPVTLLTKPTAIALIMAFVITLIYITFKKTKSLLLKILVLLILITSCIVLANKMLTTYDVIDNYLLGEIIYGMSYHKSYSYHYLMALQPEADIYIPDNGLKPIYQIALFIIHNPLYWLKLFCSKVFYLVVHVRPYWSITHNLHALAFLISSYSLIFIGFRRNIFNRRLFLISISYLGSHMLIVGLTSVDYDGRFIVPMLPIIFLLAGKVLADIIRKSKMLQRFKLS